MTYSAAKAALHAYVRGMARPLGLQGVRINAVAPGNILFEGSVWERKLAADADAVQLMLDRSAYIDAESPNQTTPIMKAARGGHILTVKLLLDEGADVTLKNGAGMTAIDFAREGGFKDIVEGLTYRLKKAGKL